MTFHIITIFPEMFDSYFKESILCRAIKQKIIKIKFYNPRDFIPRPHSGQAKHKQIDDKPYGGGPGMVMMAEPIIRAVAHIKSRIKNQDSRIMILSPNGKKFTNKYAITLAKKHQHLVLISGRYEGIDARVKKVLRAQEISIGDYVLTGGELPAMVIIDIITRQIKGVLGKNESVEENRISSPEIYTRPEIIKYKNKNYKVPKILLSGHHKNIENWKKKRT